MSGNRLLLDSNILIYLSKRQLFLNHFARAGDYLHISVITLMEVKGFAFATKREELFIDNLCKYFFIEHLNDVIVDEVIKIRKKHRIKLPDAIILATAFLNDYTLVTRNTDDFKQFSNSIKIIDPFNK